MSKYLLLFVVFFPVNLFAMQCGGLFPEDPSLLPKTNTEQVDVGVTEVSNQRTEPSNTIPPRYDAQLGSQSGKNYGFEGNSSTGPNAYASDGYSDLF